MEKLALEEAEAAKVYPVFNGESHPQKWVGLAFDKDLKKKQTYVAHYFEKADGELGQFEVGVITLVAPTYVWITFEKGTRSKNEVKCFLPESG